VIGVRQRKRSFELGGSRPLQNDHAMISTRSETHVVRSGWTYEVTKRCPVYIAKPSFRSSSAGLRDAVPSNHLRSEQLPLYRQLPHGR